MEIEIFKHSEIDIASLKQIINVKSIAWPYTLAEQLRWIAKNLNNDDLHVLLKSDDNAIAYLNLIEIEVYVDGSSRKAYGLGNVCAKEKGKSYGTELMKKVNDFLIEKNHIGILLCKSNLVEFYRKNGWSLLGKNKIQLSFNNDEIQTMFFNHDENFEHLLYLGKPF